MASTNDSDQVATLVVGCPLNGLSVVRTLAAPAQISVMEVGTTYAGSALWSRYASARRIRDFTGPSFTEGMASFGKKFTHAQILLLTDEECVHSASKNRAKLSKWFRFRQHDKCVKTLTGKASLHEFSFRHAFPIPRSVVLERHYDLAQLSQVKVPCVLKADDKRSVLTGKVERAVRVNSLNEAHRQASLMLNSGNGGIA